MALLTALLEALRPPMIITFGLIYAVVSAVELLFSLRISTLLSPTAFRKYWFARFWRLCGPLAYKVAKPAVGPLLAQAKGRVLDIGTGTGDFLVHYDPKKVTKLYAVEINPGQHAGLRRKAQEAGLADRFEILDKPVELLRGHSEVKRGEIDTIVTIQVLCSVSEPKQLIRELYELLKPGGCWIVYEHVKIHAGLLYWYQRILNLVWPKLFDGCTILRDSGRDIEQTGKWASVSLHVPDGEPGSCVIPHTVGVLYKA